MRKEKYIDNFNNIYVRVTKRTAEKAYNNGMYILLAPVNANMNYMFFPGVYVDNSDGASFNRTVAGFEWFNCNNELGKYAKYFIEEKEGSFKRCTL